MLGMPSIRLTLMGGALLAAVVGGIVAYTIYRRTLETIVSEAHKAAKSDILSGAAQVAAAADHELARARDPDALDKALEAGGL